MFLRLYLLLVPSLDWLHKCLYKFCEEVLGGRNKRWSRSFRKGMSLRKSRSLIVAGIRFFCWALGAGKLILLSSRIGWRIVTRAPLSMRSWSHCNRDLIVILSNRLANPLDMELLELSNGQFSALAEVLLVGRLGGCLVKMEGHLSKLYNHGIILEKVYKQLFLMRWEI